VVIEAELGRKDCGSIPAIAVEIGRKDCGSIPAIAVEKGLKLPYKREALITFD
jgi:hypothetical protein